MAAPAVLPANMTAPTAALGPQTSLVKDMQAANKFAEDATANKDKAIQEQRAVVQGQRQDLKDFAKNNPFPKPDIKPFTENPPENKPLENFGSWASIIGIVAGAITQRGIATSLNASAAAMSALTENNWDLYNEHKETWRQNTELAIKQADWEAKSLGHALSLIEKDMNLGLTEAELVLAQADNQAALGLVKQGNIKALFDMQQSMATFAAEGPKRQWEMMQFNAATAAVQAKVEEWRQQNPAATPEQLSMATNAIIDQVEMQMNVQTPTQAMDAKKYSAALEYADELNRSIPPEIKGAERAKLEAQNIKTASDAVGLMSGGTTSLMNMEILRIRDNANRLREAARASLTGPALEEELMRIDRAQQEELSQLSRAGEGGRGGATLRNQMNAVTNADLHLEALELLLSGNKEAIGAWAKGSALAQSVIEQLPDGVDIISKDALKDKALVAENVAQLTTMALPFLSQAYGGSAQWSKDRRNLMESLLSPDAVLSYPDKAQAEVKRLRASLAGIKKTQEASQVKSMQGFGGLQSSTPSGGADAVPERPSDVPENAQYSPSMKKWYWQEKNGEWKSN